MIATLGRPLVLIGLGVLCASLTGCGSDTDAKLKTRSAELSSVTARESSDTGLVRVRYRIVAEPLVYGSRRFGYYVALRLDRPLPLPIGSVSRYHVVVNGQSSNPLRRYPGRPHSTACYRADFETPSLPGAATGDPVAVAIIDFGSSTTSATRITRRRATILRNPFGSDDLMADRVQQLVRDRVDAMGCRASSSGGVKQP